MPRLRWLAAAAILLVVGLVGAGVVLVARDGEPGEPNPATTSVAPRQSLLSYLRMPGDQVVVVPNGTYAGGAVIAEHPPTDGELGGWLVLVAESRGGVVVDLSARDLRLREGTSRVAFVGMSFRNGRIRNHGTQIRYWYTTHTFPYDDWVDAGGPDGPHSRPKTMLIGDAEEVEIYGADFSEIGDDAINLHDSRDVVIEGTVFSDVVNDGHGDLIHADAIQVQGDVRRMTIRQSVIERQHIGTEGNGDVAKVLWEDCWFRDSLSAGITFAAKGSSATIKGKRRDIWSFGHRSGDDRLDVVDGERRRAGSAPRRIDVTDTRVRNRRPPTGTPSPAEVWRAAHPYGSWSTTLFRRNLRQ